MTPHEKAKELVNKYLAIQFGDFPTTEAKQCALIAVDEILNTIEYSSQADEMAKTIYWNEVKQEIEKR